MRQRKSQNQQQPGSVSNMLNATVEAQSLVKRMVSYDAHHHGGTAPAMRHLARRLGRAFGTIRNLYHGVRKSVDADLFAAIKREQYRRLQEDIARAEHEISIARAVGYGPSDAEFQALADALADARKVRGL